MAEHAPDLEAQLAPLIPALRRYARALLRDRTAADDLVHDCLERAIGRWSQRRGDARTWVLAILHNLAMNQLRRSTRRGRHVELADADAGDPALARPATQQDRLQHEELLRALAQLPEDQRSVLLLVGVEDLSYADAARVLAVPIGTVMSRLSRARERLHRLLADDAAALPVALRSVP